MELTHESAAASGMSWVWMVLRRCWGGGGSVVCEEMKMEGEEIGFAEKGIRKEGGWWKPNFAFSAASCFVEPQLFSRASRKTNCKRLNALPSTL